MQHGLCIVYMLGARGSLILRFWYFNRLSCTRSSYLTFFKKWIRVLKHNNIQLLTGFEDNSRFVWHEDWSVTRSHRLRSTDLFKGQTKLLLSEKPVYNCIVLHLHFIIIFLLMITLSTRISRISIRCFQDSRPSKPRIWTSPQHCDIVTLISCDLLNQWK